MKRWSRSWSQQRLGGYRRWNNAVVSHGSVAVASAGLQQLLRLPHKPLSSSSSRYGDLHKPSSWSSSSSSLSQCTLLVSRRGISKAARRRNASRNAGVSFYPAYLAPPEISPAGLERIESFHNYKVLETVHKVEDWATMALDSLKLQNDDNPAPSRSSLLTSIGSDNWNHGCSTLLGIYVGWNDKAVPRKERAVTHLLSIALPQQPVAVLHLSSNDLNVQSPHSLPSSLRALLEHRQVLVTGNVGTVHRHLARLRRQLDIYVGARVELDQWARHVEKTRHPMVVSKEDAVTGQARRRNPHLPPPARDMSYLCRHYLNVEMDPTFAKDLVYSADKDDMPKTTIQYGALQAEQSLLVAQALQQHQANLLRDTGTEPAVSTKMSKQEQHEQSLYVGQRVLVYFDGKLPVAEGIIEFLGGRHGGVSQLWGPDLLVNTGKALVRIDKVLMDQAIPTFADTTWPLYYRPGQAVPWDRKLRLSHVYWSPVPIVAAMTRKLQPLQLQVVPCVEQGAAAAVEPEA
jgi:hypothetical protein